MPAPLAQRLGEAASAAQIAAAVITTWHLIHDVLTPVLGGRGWVALYQRTLLLIAQGYTALAEWPEAATELKAAATPAALRLLIARQTPACATALGACLLQTFHGLLAGLVGPPLTERLLHQVWTQVPGGPPAQNTLP